MKWRKLAVGIATLALILVLVYSFWPPAEMQVELVFGAQGDITALDTKLEFNTTNGQSNQVARIPGLDRVVVASTQSTTVVNVQAFNVNRNTGAVTAIGSAVDIEPGTAGSIVNGMSLVMIDASNFAVFWVGAGSDGFAQLFDLDATGNISANGSAIEYDIDTGTWPASVLMDSTHILTTWTGASIDGFAAIFTVNTGTGSISLTGTPFEFDTSDYTFGSLAKLSDTKAIVFYRGAFIDGFARVLDINTSTWAVTAAGDAFEYLDASTITGNSVVAMDTESSPMVVINGWGDSGTGDSEIQSFQINTSTWAITAFGSVLDLATDDATGSMAIAVVKLDDTHVVAFYQGTLADGFARVIELNPSTGALTALGSEIEPEIENFTWASGAYLEAGLSVAAWSGGGVDGFIQAFSTCAAECSFTTSGTYTVPTGVTALDVEVWGGGGSGSCGRTRGGAGGGGGAFSKAESIAVSEGQEWTVTVGIGGTAAASCSTSDTNGNAGNDSAFALAFATSSLAKGGSAGTGSCLGPATGGAGGASADSIGDTKFSGGKGGDCDGNFTNSGGGGGGAGTTEVGGAGGNATSGASGAGGTGGTADGGDGSAGNHGGVAGSTLGGASGGTNLGTPAAGARGEVRITEGVAGEPVAPSGDSGIIWFTSDD